MTNEPLRYTTFSKHLKEQFKNPLVKICVDAGFTCPNRDGTKGYGGCIYCNDAGSGAPYIERKLDVQDQINERLAKVAHFMKNPDVLVYFQAFSNTYAPVEDLEKLYRSALDREDVVGLSIGTRPDCILPDILDLIAALSKETYLWLEFGLESMHQKTLDLTNRLHTYQEFLDAYWQAKERGIKVCIHLIAGLPGETKEDIIETAKAVGKLEPDGVKIHSLYIESKTKLHQMYKSNPWDLFTEDEYIELVAQLLEYLPEKTIVQRLVGEAIRDRLVAPLWSLNKSRILQKINKKLIEWDSWQGKRFEAARKKESAEYHYA